MNFPWLVEKMHVVCFRRQFNGPLSVPGVRLTAQALEWRAVGGPWSARVRADGEIGRLQGLAALLRCGLHVYDERGAAWWGYVSAVELHEGARVARVSLDEMGNRVAVTYRQPAPNPGGGERVTTAWVEDADSIRFYGQKERIFPAGEMTAAQAEGLAAGLLGKVGQPASGCSTQEDQGSYAILEGRGWWQTLDWQHYTDTRGAVGNYTSGTGLALGSAPSSAKWAQSFAVGPESWEINEVWVRLRKELQPGDSVRLELCADGGSGPGPALFGVSLPASLISSEWEWVRFPLPATSLNGGGLYWVQLSRTGAPDGANHYQISSDQKLGYPDGVLRCWNGSAWQPPLVDGDLCFMVRGTVARSTLLKRVLGSAAPGCGQFFIDVRLEAGVEGAVASPYYPQPVSARELVEGLLLGGGPNHARLLAQVDPWRAARVIAQPSSARPAAVMDTTGQLRGPTGRRLAPSEQPSGQWVLFGAVPGGPKLANLGAVFANRVTWKDGEGMKVSHE